MVHLIRQCDCTGAITIINTNLNPRIPIAHFNLLTMKALLVVVLVVGVGSDYLKVHGSEMLYLLKPPILLRNFFLCNLK